MPYKDPERKRQWEREHREQRNARRRARLPNQTLVTPKPAPDPLSNQPTSGWKALLGLAVGVGIALVAALAGAELSGLGGSDAIGPPK